MNQLNVSYLTDDNFSSLAMSQVQQLANQKHTPGNVPEITMQAGCEDLTRCISLMNIKLFLYLKLVNYCSQVIQNLQTLHKAKDKV